MCKKNPDHEIDAREQTILFPHQKKRKQTTAPSVMAFFVQTRITAKKK